MSQTHRHTLPNHAAAYVEAARDEASTPGIDEERIRALPRGSAPWQMTVCDAPRSCDPAGLFRLILVVSPAAGHIRNMALITSAYGNDGQLLQALEEAMLASVNDLEPARPPKLLVDSPQLVELLSEPLAACGIAVVGKQPLHAIDRVLEQLAERRDLFRDTTLLGTTVFETELAKVAAQIASKEPFRRIYGELPLAVRYADEAEPPRILVLMGAGCEVRGVVAYRDARAYRAAPELPVTERQVLPWEQRRVAHWALLFQPACEISPMARAAFSRRGLEVAHELYPRFRRMCGTGTPDIESRQDARAMLRELTAVAHFLSSQDHQAFGKCPVPMQTTVQGRAVLIEPRLELAQPSESQPSEQPSGPWFGASGGVPLLGGEPVDENDEILPFLLEVEHSLAVTQVPAGLLGDLLPPPVLRSTSDQGRAAEQCATLVIDVAESDAPAVMAALSAVDSIQFRRIREQGTPQEAILGLSKGQIVGVIGRWQPAAEQTALAEQWAGSYDGVIAVVCSGQRTGAPKLRLNEIIGAKPVTIVPLTVCGRS